MKENQIKVLMVSPGEHPVIVSLENELEALQKAVSIGADYTGLIELVGLEPGISILCNEEGKLIGLEPNRRFGQDILCGVFYVVGEDEEGNLASLSEAQMERFKAMFWEPDVIPCQEVERTIFAKVFPWEG